LQSDARFIQARAFPPDAISHEQNLDEFSFFFSLSESERKAIAKMYMDYIAASPKAMTFRRILLDVVDGDEFESAVNEFIKR